MDAQPQPRPQLRPGDLIVSETMMRWPGLSGAMLLAWSALRKRAGYRPDTVSITASELAALCGGRNASRARKWIEGLLAHAAISQSAHKEKQTGRYHLYIDDPEAIASLRIKPAPPDDPQLCLPLHDADSAAVPRVEPRAEPPAEPRAEPPRDTPAEEKKRGAQPTISPQTSDDFSTRGEQNPRGGSAAGTRVAPHTSDLDRNSFLSPPPDSTIPHPSIGAPSQPEVGSRKSEVGTLGDALPEAIGSALAALTDPTAQLRRDERLTAYIVARLEDPEFDPLCLAHAFEAIRSGAWDEHALLSILTRTLRKRDRGELREPPRAYFVHRLKTELERRHFWRSRDKPKSSGQ